MPIWKVVEPPSARRGELAAELRHKGASATRSYHLGQRSREGSGATKARPHPIGLAAAPCAEDFEREGVLPRLPTCRVSVELSRCGAMRPSRVPSRSRFRGNAPAKSASPFGDRARRLALPRSEEHTSELQSHLNLVCRLLLEKK